MTVVGTFQRCRTVQLESVIRLKAVRQRLSFYEFTPWLGTNLGLDMAQRQIAMSPGWTQPFSGGEGGIARVEPRQSRLRGFSRGYLSLTD
jgi:hypothetical protein